MGTSPVNPVDVVPQLSELLVRGGRVEPFRPSEVRWSWKAEEKERRGSGLEIRVSRDHLLAAVSRAYGLPQSTVRFARRAADGDGFMPDGCGVSVRTISGEYAILTAHVLHDYAGELRKGQLSLSFTPPADVIHSGRLPQSAPRRSVGFAILAPVTRVQDLGEAAVGRPVHPGLPDLAVAILDYQALQRLLDDVRTEHGRIYAQEPRWIDLADEPPIGVDHSAPGSLDYGRGNWFLSGVLAKPPTVGWMNFQTIGLSRVDRIYERNAYQYYGIDLDTSQHPEYPSFEGFSGSGLWQVRLSPEGESKLRADSQAGLIGSDLQPPRLAGVVFYQQRLSGGRRGYEIYAHKLSPELAAELSQRPPVAEGRSLCGLEAAT